MAPGARDLPVCVLGLGLIGGSLVRAASRAGREVCGYNRSAGAIAAAASEGHRVTTSLDDALGWAAERNALIVVAVPMPALAPLLGAIGERAPHCPLTDVTSVKTAVLRAVDDAGLLARFVGGHPMTGTEHSGWGAGHAELFAAASWVVAVDDHVDPGCFSAVTALALDCGAVVVPARSDDHDAAVAAVSHLPHLVAEAVAAVAADSPLALSLAAGSFRDVTRVAATAPELVRAMCEANAADLVGQLDRAVALLRGARDALADRAPIAELVDAGHTARLDYEGFTRHDIVEVVVGAGDWRAELAAAGRAGGVLRAVPPGRGN